MKISAIKIFRNSIFALMAVALFGAGTAFAQSIDLSAGNPGSYTAPGDVTTPITVEVYNAPTQGEITVTISATSGSANIDFYDYYYTEYTCSELAYDIGAGNYTCSYSENTGSDYYVYIDPTTPSIQNLVVEIGYQEDPSNTYTMAEYIDACSASLQRTDLTQIDYGYRFVSMINVPAGANLTVDTGSGTGNVDLYVYDADYNDYCNSDIDIGGDGTAEQCLISGAFGGRYFIELDASDAYADVVVDVSHDGDCGAATTIYNGFETSSPINDTTGNWKYYVSDIPANVTEIVFRSTEEDSGSPNPNADLYYDIDADPTTSTYEGRSVDASNNDEIYIDENLSLQEYHFGVYAQDTYDNVGLFFYYLNGLLESGVAETGLTVLDGEGDMFYAIDVPVGATNLEVTTNDGTGNVNLYMRYNQAPTETDYDWYDGGPGNYETINVSNPESGVYMIKLDNYSGFDGVSLTGTVTRPSPVVLPNSREIPVDLEIELYGTTGNWDYYKVAVPTGASDLKLETYAALTPYGEPEGADLYYKYGSSPTLVDYDGSSTTASENDELIEVAGALTAGDYYIGVYGAGDYENVGLRVNFVNSELSNGIAVDLQAASIDKEGLQYKIDVPTGATNLVISTASGSGNSDLFVKYGDFVTWDDWDYSSTSGNTTDSVSIPAPSAGTYYAQLYNTSDFTGVSITASWTEPPLSATPIYNGKTETGISGAEDEWNYYSINVPSGSTRMQVIMEDEGANNVEADLFERYDDFPTDTPGQYDHSDALNGNDASIAFNNPTAGTHYIGVYCRVGGGDCGPVSLTVRVAVDSLDLDGGSATGLSAGTDEWIYYTTYVPFSDYDEFIVETSEGGSPTGDVDLYVNFGSFPDGSGDTAQSADPGDRTEYVNFNPNGGTYYIGLKAALAFSDINLTLNYGESSSWGVDNIGSSGDYQMESNSGGDYLLTGGTLYKRDGRNWNVDGTFPSDSYLSGERIYSQNGANVDVYELSGGSYVLAQSNAIIGNTMGLVSDTHVFALDGTIHDCTVLDSPCDSTPATLSHGGSIYNIAMSGTDAASTRIAIVDGSYGALGALYVYLADGTLEDGPIEPGHGIGGFGYSMDMHADQIIIGMQFSGGEDPGEECPGTGTCPGAAFVYKNNGGSWEKQDIFTGGDLGDGEQSSGSGFSVDVSIYNNYAIIGADTKNGPTVESGSSVYLFERTVGGETDPGRCDNIPCDEWTEVLRYDQQEFGFGDEVDITGNYYYGVAGPLNSGGGIIINNNPLGSNGGGGGVVPEFSDYMLILTIIVTIAFMAKVTPKIGAGIPLIKK